MLSVGIAKSDGSQTKRLRPFEVAPLLIPIADGQTVKVIDATDEQFQTFIRAAGVPVDEQGVLEWSFDDRVGIVNHALKYGVSLLFANENDSEIEQKQLENNSDAAQNEMTEMASEGDITNEKRMKMVMLH